MGGLDLVLSRAAARAVTLCITLLAALLATLLWDAALAGDLDPGASARPASLPETVRRWTFDSPEDLEGWEAGAGIEGLRVEEGRLRGKTTAADAYLFAPPVRAPLDGLVVRVRWSCPRGGTGQCYFATEEKPQMAEDRQVSLEMPAGALAESEFVLDPAGAGGSLTRFRLDPCNGLAEGVPFEIDEVALVRLPPRLELTFAPARCAVEAGEKVALRLRSRRLGGRKPSGMLSAALEHPPGTRLDSDPAASSGEMETSFPSPGIHRVQARLAVEGRAVEVAEAAVAVGLGETPSPEAPSLRGGGMTVELVPDAGGSSSFGGARLWVEGPSGPREAGLLLPLLELVTEVEGMPRRTCPGLRLLEREPRRLRLGVEGARPGDVPLELEIAVESDRGPPRRGPGPRELLSLRARLQQGPGTRLLLFSGPVLRVRGGGAGSLERLALFGGIEMLEPGWPSSSPRAVGPRFAERFTPHPFKVALPVMAVEAGGVLTALLWDPLQGRSPPIEGRAEALPAATFATPDLLDGQPSHRLQLSLPRVGPLRGENEARASRPLILDQNPLEIRFAIHAAAGEPLLASARRWYEHFGIPEAPPAPHPPRKLHDLLARSFGETVWWPSEKGWRSHWFLEERGHFRPDLAAELALHARLTGERRWVEATGVDAARPLIEIAGTLWGRAAAGAGSSQSVSGARRAVLSMGEDGTFAFRNSSQAREATRRHTGGRFDSLGEDGSTSLGTCVQGLLPLLRHLLFTGEAESLPAAERGLQALRRFRVPRGAQVWEVHQEIPDIRASALAVEALRLGYLLTGEEAYLRDALGWAESGLPFIFTWRTPLEGEAVVRTSSDRDDPRRSRSHPASDLFQDPRRQVNPYGTIPVLGPSFYTVSWFGVLVQWCGLEWAVKVLEVLELQDDPVLRPAASGVARSGLQQMFDLPPWTGLYPDVWDLKANSAGGALLHPRLLLDALRGAGELPQELRVWSRRSGPGREALLVHGFGSLRSLERDSGSLLLEVEFLPGELGEVLVARAPRPRSVWVDGAALPEEEAALREERLEAQEGFRHDAARRLLGIRYRARAREARIEVRFE